MNKGEKSFLKRKKALFAEKGYLNNSYLDLYSDLDEDEDEDLSIILSSMHYQLNEIFNYMNGQISCRYFHADQSREYVDLIKEKNSICSNIESEKIILTDNYNDKIKEINKFIKISGGTSVPENFEEIKIIETKYIFLVGEKIAKNNTKSLSLNLIGEGSYARVYKFYDDDYDETFVLKRLKNKITEKDEERFKREFEIMKTLKNPYIIKVYKYNEISKEYIMEYADINLYDYISKNNGSLNFGQRFSIINQINRAFSCLEKKKILHRDISPMNILIKLFDDLLVVKVCDFGLVKLEKSMLTSPNTEFRGSLNDPKLELIGLDKYSEIHETYALTRLYAFILTGKRDISKIKNKDIMKFIKKGISSEEERYKNIDELTKETKKLKDLLND